MEKKSRKAVMKCAEWLAYCVKIGWPISSLDRLEELWWEHHDWKTGEVKKVTHS
jgi:hypothetical protein